MAIILKVSSEKLLAAASTLSDQGGELKGLTDRMLNLIGEISADMWSGEAAMSYKTKFAALSGDMARIHAMIREHVTDLQGIARTYQTTETENQELSGALASDVIL